MSKHQFLLCADMRKLHKHINGSAVTLGTNDLENFFKEGIELANVETIRAKSYLSPICFKLIVLTVTENRSEVQVYYHAKKDSEEVSFAFSSYADITTIIADKDGECNIAASILNAVIKNTNKSMAFSDEMGLPYGINENSFRFGNLHYLTDGSDELNPITGESVRKDFNLSCVVALQLGMKLDSYKDETIFKAPFESHGNRLLSIDQWSRFALYFDTKTSLFNKSMSYDKNTGLITETIIFNPKGKLPNPDHTKLTLNLLVSVKFSGDSLVKYTLCGKELLLKLTTPTDEIESGLLGIITDSIREQVKNGSNPIILVNDYLYENDEAVSQITLSDEALISALEPEEEVYIARPFVSNFIPFKSYSHNRKAVLDYILADEAHVDRIVERIGKVPLLPDSFTKDMSGIYSKGPGATGFIFITKNMSKKPGCDVRFMVDLHNREVSYLIDGPDDNGIESYLSEIFHQYVSAINKMEDYYPEDL